MAAWEVIGMNVVIWLLMWVMVLDRLRKVEVKVLTNAGAKTLRLEITQAHINASKRTRFADPVRVALRDFGFGDVSISKGKATFGGRDWYIGELFLVKGEMACHTGSGFLDLWYDNKESVRPCWITFESS